jgi:hypothetical protein
MDSTVRKAKIVPSFGQHKGTSDGFARNIAGAKFQQSPRNGWDSCFQTKGQDEILSNNNENLAWME